MSRYVNIDDLPRHGKRGGLVYWRDIEANCIELEGDTQISRHMFRNMTDATFSCATCRWEALSLFDEPCCSCSREHCGYETKGEKT